MMSFYEQMSSYQPSMSFDLWHLPCTVPGCLCNLWKLYTCIWCESVHEGGRRWERPKLLLVPTHGVWMAGAVSRLGYRWRWVYAQQAVGVWSSAAAKPSNAGVRIRPRVSWVTGTICWWGWGMGGHVLGMLWAGKELPWGRAWNDQKKSGKSPPHVLWLGSTNRKGFRKSLIRNVPAASIMVRVDLGQVSCSRFAVRPCSLGWGEGEEKASTLPRGGGAHAAQLSCDMCTSCCPVRPVSSRAVLAPPRPGPAQVTLVSRLCPCFLTPCFVASWKKQYCLIFPGRRLISIPPSCTRSHTKRDRVNLFVLFADFCYSSLFFSAVHPSRDPQKPDGATKNSLLFSKLLLNNFFSPSSPLHIPQSLHLLQCCPQRRGSNLRCAHRSASIRAYYLIFPTIHILKSIFFPWIFFFLFAKVNIPVF